MIQFSSLLPVLLLFTSHAQRAGCDMKNAECLDDKQVFVQLRSELRDSKDSVPGVAAHPRGRWRRRNRRNGGYNPYYGPRTATTTTTTSSISTSTGSTTTTASSTATIPVCKFTYHDPWVALVENDTEVDFPPSEKTTVLLVVDASFAGCCVVTTVVGRVRFGSSPGGRFGNLTLSLETPDLQSQPVGVASNGGTGGFSNYFRGNFPGAAVAGVWKLIVEASPDAAGWRAVSSVLTAFIEQCAWLTWLWQGRWWKHGCLNQLRKCKKWASRKLCLRCVFLRHWYTN